MSQHCTQRGVPTTSPGSGMSATPGPSPCQVKRILKAIDFIRKSQTTHTPQEKPAPVNGTLYARIWLMDDTRNNNGWRVTWESIKRHANTFIGKPAIMYSNCDDPKGCMLDHVKVAAQKDVYQETLRAQHKYAVSRIVDVELDESTHTAYAIHEITDPKAAGLIKSGRLRHVSPSIQPDAEHSIVGMSHSGEMMVDTDRWRGIHDAFVDVPAYGPKAQVHEICEDNRGMCGTHLKDRSQQAGPGTILQGAELDKPSSNEVATEKKFWDTAGDRKTDFRSVDTVRRVLPMLQKYYDSLPLERQKKIDQSGVLARLQGVIQEEEDARRQELDDAISILKEPSSKQARLSLLPQGYRPKIHIVQQPTLTASQINRMRNLAILCARQGRITHDMRYARLAARFTRIILDAVVRSPIDPDVIFRNIGGKVRPITPGEGGDSGGGTLDEIGPDGTPKLPEEVAHSPLQTGKIGEEKQESREEKKKESDKLKPESDGKKTPNSPHELLPEKDNFAPTDTDKPADFAGVKMSMENADEINQIISDLKASKKDSLGLTITAEGKAYDAFIKEDRDALTEYIYKTNPNFDRTKPVYILGLTNNDKGVINEDTVRAYNRALSEDNPDRTGSAFNGWWKDKDNNEFLDASIPQQFADDDEASLRSLYADQQCVIKFKLNGPDPTFTYRPTDKYQEWQD